jgi:NADH:ubiquinone oxidoreductase subunit 6 (subunit J)
MLTTLFVVVGGVMMLVLLAVVVAAIKQEAQAEELARQAPDALTAWVRRLLGVYVRKPDQPPAPDEDYREPVSYPWEPPRWPEGPAE